VVVTLALVELSLRGLAAAGWLRLPAPPPAQGQQFWDGGHPRFGVWHRPGAALRHASACFDVEYRANSVGARDRERERVSPRRRVVVLGDSFVEGWGLPEEERLTNRLERATGVEHLNFGMAHQGPYQYSLVYRDLASRYSHDALLVALLPANDFFDLDYELARLAPSYEYLYRPYLIGHYPEYREFFPRESPLAGWLRRNTHAANAAAFAWRRARRWLAPARGALVSGAPGLPHSFAYDFSDAHFDLLRHSLERIREQARGRPIALLLIPSHRDFPRYAASGASPLAGRLRALAAAQGMRLLDLLPPMFAESADPQPFYFLPCDYHWNARANALAAELVRRQLGDLLYPED